MRVVELATVVAGPGAGRYLADFGAEVIKVEAPGGDPTRRMGWIGPGETDSYFWKLVNRNKEVVSLDLKTAEGKAGLWALLVDADVLIENMRPGKLEALGFGPPEAAQAQSQDSSSCASAGFGQDGPYAMHPGFATIAEALSGFSGLLGEADGPPLLPPIAVTDEVTALVGAFCDARRAAPRRADRRGAGGRRQSAQVDVPDHGAAGLRLCAYGLSAAAAGLGHSLHRAARHLSAAPTASGWRFRARRTASPTACWT